jgi:hypothetical protein
MYVPRAMYSFRCRSGSCLKFGGCDALLACDGDVETKERRSRGVDRHRGRDGVERNAVEESLHVCERVDGDADFADLRRRQQVVGIESDLRREIEGDGEAGRAVCEQIFITRVGFFREA